MKHLANKKKILRSAHRMTGACKQSAAPI